MALATNATSSGADLEVLLRRFARTCANEPEVGLETRCLLDLFKVSWGTVEDFFVYYDSDVRAYGNEVYDDILIRFVLHLHNNLPGSWHVQRQRLICDTLARIRPEAMVEIGFGVPGRYVKSSVLSDQIVGGPIHLLDKFSSAREFGSALVNLWRGDASRVVFGEFDLDDATHYKRVPASPTYVLFDVIEHARNPDSGIDQLLCTAPPGACFLLSLPIGPRVPVHFIDWPSPNSALKWVRHHGLRIVRTWEIHPNPSVDLFARSIAAPFWNLVVEAYRI